MPHQVRGVLAPLVRRTGFGNPVRAAVAVVPHDRAASLYSGHRGGRAGNGAGAVAVEDARQGN